MPCPYTDGTMSLRIWLKLGTTLLVAIFAIAIFEAWRAERRDTAQLEAELAATKQALSAADARQRDRDTQLTQTLASLATEKRAATTPIQILHDLPNVISLPTPLTQQPDAPSTSTQTTRPLTGKAGSGTGTETPKPQQVLIPTEDLKPLYDFGLDCKTCQAKLAAAQGDLTDEKTKTVALTKERDDALRAARGGSVLRRIARAAKWFAIGAAAGAIAAKTAR
jgi:type II secretory pathway pseudopilin PulG